MVAKLIAVLKILSKYFSQLLFLFLTKNNVRTLKKIYALMLLDFYF